jgi:hypothetical protein
MSREVVGSARRLYGGEVNASQSTLLRALSGLGYAALLLTFFEACSGDDTSTPTPPDGPASIAISGIALGHGFLGDGGAASILGCDYTIGVNVQTTNWTLSSPGRCSGALQCGQLRVTLLDGENKELKQVMAAGNGVALDVRSALSAVPPLNSFRYTIRAELIEDSGKPYVEVDGGNGSARQDFEMALPARADCSSTPAMPDGGGGAPIVSNAGAAGDHAIDGGGAGGDHAANDTAGAAGTAAEGGAPAAPPAP